MLIHTDVFINNIAMTGSNQNKTSLVCVNKNVEFCVMESQIKILHKEYIYTFFYMKLPYFCF
jgi:hypothetical protein